MKRIAICLVFLALCFSAAEAHDTWLMPPIGWVSEGDSSIVPLTEGHHAVPEGAPPGEITIEVVSPSGAVAASGTIIDEVLDEYTKKNGPYYYIEFDVDETGMYVAKSEHHEGALTFVCTSFGTEPEEMEAYDDIDWDSVDKSGWESDWYITDAYVDAVKFAKTFLVVENSDFESASQPLGQKMEIIPLDNITTVGTGDFRFQVLFDGEPRSGIDVTAMKAYCDQEITGVTDDEGKVTLNLPEKGDWLIKAGPYKDGSSEALPYHGSDSSEKSFVGTCYNHVLTLRSDHVQPEAS